VVPEVRSAEYASMRELFVLHIISLNSKGPGA